MIEESFTLKQFNGTHYLAFALKNDLSDTPSHQQNWSYNIVQNAG